MKCNAINMCQNAYFHSLVGKRIIMFEKIADFINLTCRCGIIRCTSSRCFTSPELMLCIEWDDEPWQLRKLVKLRDFKILFVEKAVCLLNHPLEEQVKAALLFHPCKGFNLTGKKHLVEFFRDRLKFIEEESNLCMIRSINELVCFDELEIKQWLEMKKTKKIFLTDRVCLSGHRILVYDFNSPNPWFKASIIKRRKDRRLHIKNEQVPFFFIIDPLITQIYFFDDDVINDVELEPASFELETDGVSSVARCRSVISRTQSHFLGECETDELETEDGAVAEHTMQQSSHSQSLSAQQTLLRESQKLQSQQQRSAPPMQPQIPPQFLTNPYLPPYGVFYNNPAIGASVLAQAQLQAMAAASGTPGNTLLLPWLKAAQQGGTESKDAAAQLSQQQALINALYGPKSMEGLSDYSTLLRPSVSVAPSPNSAPRAPSPKHGIQSPKEPLVKKLSHSSSPRHVDPHVLSSRDHASPRPGPIIDQEALLRDRAREDSWKAKYIGNAPRRGGSYKDGVLEERRSSMASKPWALDPSNINRSPLGMIDPATYLATHGARFIRDEVARKNGHLEMGRGDSPTSRSTSLIKPKGLRASASSSGTPWQLPTPTSAAEEKSSPPRPEQTRPRPLSSNPDTPPSSSVFNVQSLKYNPVAPPPARPHSSGHKPPSERTVIIKTSPASGGKDGQSVKYISDAPPGRQHTPSPEKLGPVMADGSRARVLSPASLSSLYRFPIPAPSNQQKTIISTGDYKVTQVLKGKESAPGHQSSAPSHLVYAKPAPLTQSDGRVARKRAVEEDSSEIDRKHRIKSPHFPPEPVRPPPNLSENSNLSDVSSDPHLRGLMGAGMLPISGAKISWGNSSNIGSEYPGAPTKVALKDALLGVEKDSALNLSSSKPSSVLNSAPILSPTKLDLAANRTSTPAKVTPQPAEVEPLKHGSTPPPDFPFSKSKADPVVHKSVGESSIRGDGDGGKSIVGEAFKPALCQKMKKAWIKRSYASEDSRPSPPIHSTPDELPAAPFSNDEERAENIEPRKKVKKKQMKEVKKKRQHKDKETRKSKKSESNSDSSHEPSSSPAPARKEDEEESCMKSGQSNSKLYLLGRLKSERSSEDEYSAESDGKKRKKKKSARNMPLGKNGLPVSVLLCRKEQTRLKKSGEPFIQDAACHEITSLPGILIYSNNATSLPKCRECRSAKRKDNSAILCRFYGFRKLVFVNGHLQSAGFCDPEDSHVSDISLWLPTTKRGRPGMEVETCRYIMKHIGAKFCELVQEEREAVAEAEKTGKIHWKRPVPGVREMCDACETTLFNLHWVCHRCGFGVCVDCYRTRQGMSRTDIEEYDNDRDNLYRWLKCGKGNHLPSHLVPTQIIPSSCLFDLCELAHEVRAKWNITSQCRCKKRPPTASSLLAPRPGDPTPLLKSHCNNELLSHSGGKSPAPTKPEAKHPPANRERLKGFDCENSASPLDWLASIALREQRKTSPATPSSVSSNSVEEKKPTEKSPQQVKVNAPAAPRSWLCNGQLLQLTDSSSSVNIDTFQLHWFYGMPVMASGASENMNRDLWKPETFSAEYGAQPTGSALINCRKGAVITNALIRDFWNGFEKIENRLRDESTGEKMILKLKDWPTTDDFIDTMPDKFDDLMRALPLPQYTAREGKFNLAAHLPDFFVRPDLGPKMYIAYGWVTEQDWNQGTTNLHLDISDACNLMVYVGVPDDEPPEALATLIDIIREGDADEAQVERARKHKPGALWHIFKADDTDRIRELILKVKAEMGTALSDDHDPIHDQQIYLDKKMRRRLREEYGVEGYPLVQCEGDSVFIPAGAPHQVFNLHSCIKVAEDFVSPEHIDNCFKLTDEFRHLSTTHSNHEDKLQLKNIMYHTMKEVVTAFNWYEGAMKLPPT